MSQAPEPAETASEQAKSPAPPESQRTRRRTLKRTLRRPYRRTRRRTLRRNRRRPAPCPKASLLLAGSPRQALRTGQTVPNDCTHTITNRDEARPERTKPACSSGFRGMRPGRIELPTCGLKDRRSLAPRGEPLTTELRARGTGAAWVAPRVMPRRKIIAQGAHQATCLSRLTSAAARRTYVPPRRMSCKG